MNLVEINHKLSLLNNITYHLSKWERGFNFHDYHKFLAPFYSILLFPSLIFFPSFLVLAIDIITLNLLIYALLTQSTLFGVLITRNHAERLYIVISRYAPLLKTEHSSLLDSARKNSSLRISDVREWVETEKSALRRIASLDSDALPIGKNILK